jgi:hypothetical protein
MTLSMKLSLFALALTMLACSTQPSPTDQRNVVGRMTSEESRFESSCINPQIHQIAPRSYGAHANSGLFIIECDSGPSPPEPL